METNRQQAMMGQCGQLFGLRETYFDCQETNPNNMLTEFGTSMKPGKQIKIRL
jgi:hypothetical protein